MAENPAPALQDSLRSLESSLGSLRTAAGPQADSAAIFARYRGLHDQVEGWFSLESAAVWDALLGLQGHDRTHGHLLEIGVHHGKSAALMAMHADPRRESCVLVDRYLAEAPIRHALELAGCPAGEHLQLLCCDSTRLAVEPLVAAGFAQFRWIHIDGEHTGRAVTSDLGLAHALLSERGVLCVDDFFNWWYPQITEAVLRYVRDHPDHFQLFLCGYNKAYLARPQFKHDALAFCADGLVPALAERDVEAMITQTTWPAEQSPFGVGPRHEGCTRRGPDWEPEAIRY